MEFDVHFQLNGYMKITADTKEEAREIANSIIEVNREHVESTIGSSSIEEDNYTTDVLEN